MDDESWGSSSLLSVSLVLSSLAFVALLGVAGFVLEFTRKIGCKHSQDHSSGAGSFFDDPNSLKKVPCPSIFDPAERYISLIIPAFNEEHRLPGALVETIKSYLLRVVPLCGAHGVGSYLQERTRLDAAFTYEIIIVDDGSTDRTSKVAFDFVRKHTVDKVRVIVLGRNHGKGEAIRKGMLHARGELLLMLDADGATQITDLQKLESRICEFAKDGMKSTATDSRGQSQRLSDVEVLAFGSRAHLEKQALATRKWYRNFLMKGFHLVVLLTAGPGIRDTQCGFKMFTRTAARKLFTNIRLKRWCFDVELVYLSKRLKIPMIEISVSWSEIPGSKVKMTSIIHMLFELLLIRLGYGLGIWKILTDSP